MMPTTGRGVNGDCPPPKVKAADCGGGFLKLRSLFVQCVTAGGVTTGLIGMRWPKRTRSPSVVRCSVSR